MIKIKNTLNMEQFENIEKFLEKEVVIDEDLLQYLIDDSFNQ